MTIGSDLTAYCMAGKCDMEFRKYDMEFRKYDMEFRKYDMDLI